MTHIKIRYSNEVQNQKMNGYCEYPVKEKSFKSKKAFYQWCNEFFTITDKIERSYFLKNEEWKQEIRSDPPYPQTKEIRLVIIDKSDISLNVYELKRNVDYRINLYEHAIKRSD